MMSHSPVPGRATRPGASPGRLARRGSRAVFLARTGPPGLLGPPGLGPLCVMQGHSPSENTGHPPYFCIEGRQAQAHEAPSA